MGTSACTITTSGADNPTEEDHYTAQGNDYFQQGDYQNALETYQKELEYQLDKLDHDHPNIAATYNSLGAVYSRLGNYPRALDMYNKSLAISVKSLGAEHPNVAITYNNIGHAYSQQGGGNPKDTRHR